MIDCPLDHSLGTTFQAFKRKGELIPGNTVVIEAGLSCSVYLTCHFCYENP